MHKLPLSPLYSVEVDDAGYLSGTVFEGALGFVIKIATTDGTFRALKVPRLLADTDKDNAYISSILEHEIAIARKLVGSPGLTGVDHGGQSVLRESVIADRQQAVLVQFSKELKPRFCLVSTDPKTDKLIFVPPLEGLSWLTKTMFQQAIAASSGGANRDAASTVVLRRPADGAASMDAALFSFSQSQAGHDQANMLESTWYLGLPSPVYFWREGTFEYAVRKDIRKAWDWRKHCDFCGQTAIGLRSLYTLNVTHGDLRPANIMYGLYPELPGDYLLIDYASFGGLSGIFHAPESNESGITRLGADIQEARQSPFYPVERRVGRERENCDSVFIRRSKDQWAVHVGYRSDMFEKGTDKLNAVTEAQLKAVLEGAAFSESSSEWKTGDRIRIRDFVFQVDGWKNGSTGFSLCSNRAWLVHNNRILIPLPSNAFDHKDRILSISRTFPIWQWSMATDFFSLGVLLLYSLYFAGDPKAPDSAKSLTDADDEFEAMIAVMSTVQHARVILPNVAAVARLLEQIWKDPTFADAADFHPGVLAALRLVGTDDDVRWKEPLLDSADKEQIDIEDDECLLGRTWAVAMSVVQTTPGAERVLNAVGKNLAVFVSLIDLAMQLMHRKEDLKKGSEASPKGLNSWMCIDRTATADASKVSELISYISDTGDGLHQRFQHEKFICPDAKVLSYSSRNETLLRIQMRNMESKIADVVDDMEGSVFLAPKIKRLRDSLSAIRLLAAVDTDGS